MSKNYQRGQVLLIVVLLMVTVLTVSLSLVTRTINNVKITQEEESSERAFSAAEAGIERSLEVQKEVTGTLINNTSYQTSLINLAGVDLLLNSGVPVLKDDASDIWLTNYPSYTSYWSGNITLYWGKSSDACSASEYANTAAALEVVVISGTKANPVSTHYSIDPCSSRASVNNFEYISPGGTTVGGQPFGYKKTITVNSGILIRVIPLYAPTPLAARGCNAIGGGCLSLPNQGTLIQSTGIADTAQRKIVSFQGYPKLPTEIFPFVLFSLR